MVDYSAGEISTAESTELINYLNEQFHPVAVDQLDRLDLVFDLMAVSAFVRGLHVDCEQASVCMCVIRACAEEKGLSQSVSGHNFWAGSEGGVSPLPPC